MVEKVQARIKKLEQTKTLSSKKKHGEASQTPVSDEVMKTITKGLENIHLHQVQTAENTLDSPNKAAPKKVNITEPAGTTEHISRSERMKMFETDPEFRNKDRVVWLSMPSSENGGGLPDKPASIFTKFYNVFGRKPVSQRIN
jgi:hypothetical protein